MYKRSICLILIFVMVCVTGCGGKNYDRKTDNGKTKDGVDRELGLQSAKVRNIEGLTEQQKKVVQYYNDDYIVLEENTAFEFLQRYPDALKGTQIQLKGKVKKVISSDEENYELLVWIGPEEESFFTGSGYVDAYEMYEEAHENDYVVIKGAQGESRFVEDDEIEFRGVYESIENYSIDGTDYSLPTISIDWAYYGRFYQIDEELYDAAFIKDVAKAIFGDNIMITTNEFDALEWEEVATELDFAKQDIQVTLDEYNLLREDLTTILSENTIENNTYYICELEDQSNANFSSYYFLSGKGKIVDAKTFDKEGLSTQIEFAPDFEHFFLVTYDSTLKSLSIRYYDKELERIWEREFEDTESYCYDYTSQTVYTIVNNELYSINIETGEDNIEPVFIGNKTYVRKLEDGLLSIDQTTSTDAIMKTDLNGEIIWKVTTTGKIDTVGSIQIVDDNIVVAAKIIEDDGGAHKDHYYVIDNETGDVLQDVIALQEDEIDDYIFKH